MNTTRTIRGLVAVLALACAATANAQQTTTAGTTTKTMPLGGKLFVNVNVGAQTQSSTATSDFSFPLYRETATVSTSATSDGGPLVGLSVGYRFVPSFGVAVDYSRVSSSGSAQGTASIPNPLFFNRPAAVTINSVDAERTDRSTSVLLVGFLPITDKMEVSVFLGPSFIRASQDLISGATVPPETQTVVTTMQRQSATAKGVNVGADLAYMFLKQVGAGFFLRYNGGKFDLASATGVKAGGFQVGVGARLLF
jgi:hypothetical protein